MVSTDRIHFNKVLEWFLKNYLHHHISNYGCQFFTLNWERAFLNRKCNDILTIRNSTRDHNWDSRFIFDNFSFIFNKNISFNITFVDCDPAFCQQTFLRRQILYKIHFQIEVFYSLRGLNTEIYENSGLIIIVFDSFHNIYQAVTF